MELKDFIEKAFPLLQEFPADASVEFMVKCYTEKICHTIYGMTDKKDIFHKVETTR